MSTALLVVDVQNEAVAKGPYRADEVLANIATLIAACRAAGVEVIYVQHDEEPGTDGAPGTEGWEIHASMRPAEGEKVVRKRYNSAFRETELEAYLEERSIDTLIVTGIQTEYCVDTTVRVAFEYGFGVVIPEWTNTTYDNGEVKASQIYELHNRRIFDGRFATLRSMEETVELIRSNAPGSRDGDPGAS